MIQTIPKAKMHLAERIAVAIGLALVALTIGAISARLTGPLSGSRAAAMATGITAAVALAFWPGQRLAYRLEADRLLAGRLVLPFAAITGVRLTGLGGTLLYGGPALPGCWSGRAWSPRIGRFWLEGSTGLGTAILITALDGRRYAITPADPARTLLLLEAHRRSAALTVPAREATAAPDGSPAGDPKPPRGGLIYLPARRPKA